ncbi:MAG: hypothetical protein WBD74_08540 [Candidatus Aquilonibacter sp.]
MTRHTRSLAIFLLLLWPAAVIAKALPMMDAMSVMDAVHAKVGHNNDLDAMLVGEGVYAVAFWRTTSTHSSGAALVKKTGDAWSVVKVLAAVPKDPTVLETLGVPAAQAKALISDIKKNYE